MSWLITYDHMSTPWRQYTIHVKVRGTLSKMDVPNKTVLPLGSTVEAVSLSSLNISNI